MSVLLQEKPPAFPQCIQVYKNIYASTQYFVNIGWCVKYCVEFD